MSMCSSLFSVMDNISFRWRNLQHIYYFVAINSKVYKYLLFKSIKVKLVLRYFVILWPNTLPGTVADSLKNVGFTD